MKRLPMVLIILAGVYTLISGYDRVLVPGKSWLWKCQNRYSGATELKKFVVEKDTVINDIECVKMLCRWKNSNGKEVCVDQYFSEEDGRIFIIDGPNYGDIYSYLYEDSVTLSIIGDYITPQKWLLSDFNLEKGDTISHKTLVYHSQNSGDYSGDYKVERTTIVVDKDMVYVAGKNRIRMKLSDKERISYWIEGIGMRDELCISFPSDIIPMPVTRSEKESYGLNHMLEYRENDELIFQTHHFADPSAPYIDYNAVCTPFEEEMPVNNQGILDLFGRQVTSPHPGNIYIRNDKKIIWKCM